MTAVEVDVHRHLEKVFVIIRPMKFGVFDHMDQAGVLLEQQFPERLRLIEAYDRFGFYTYPLAEHHGTPLGLAPSPSVYMGAVAQRTKRLRFGPLVYSLPLYHPIRLIEEICVLDHRSSERRPVRVRCRAWCVAD